MSVNIEHTTQTTVKKLNVSSFEQFIFDKNHLRQLSKALEKKAEIELNEIPESRKAEIDEFRNMVLKENGFKANTSDASLLRFLRARKFDKTRALQLMKNYYKVRKTKIVTCRKLLPSNDMKPLEKETICVLPHKDAQGRAVFYWRAEKWDTKELDLTMEVRMGFMSAEKLLQDEGIQICGFVAILDYIGFSFDHARQFTPYMIHVCSSFLQDGAPFRLKAIHILHENKFFDFVYALVKPFLKRKLKERIILHGNDLTSLHEHISPDVLPEELGGTQGPVNNKEWCEIMLKSEQEFMDDMNFGYNRQKGNC